MLTTIGRKSGQERTVQIAHLEVEDGWIVVASNFGQKNHPAWSYNLDANPEATVQAGSEVVPVQAERLSDEEKESVWSRLVETTPQFAVYRTRTDRNIRVYRLRRR